MHKIFLYKVGEETEVDFEPWSQWTECSRTCGGGRQARSRTCVIGPGVGFVKCTGDLTDIRDCNTHDCPGIYCVYYIAIDEKFEILFECGNYNTAFIYCSGLWMGVWGVGAVQQILWRRNKQAVPKNHPPSTVWRKALPWVCSWKSA